MGNTIVGCFEDLFYLRSWTPTDVAEFVDAVRRRRTSLVLERQSFADAARAAAPLALQVFDDLDTDFDKKVDTFEVVATVVVWSCLQWEEKLDLLFNTFDFNRKGELRVHELTFLIATVVRATKKFVHFDVAPETAAEQRALAAQAFENGERQSSALSLESFRSWFDASEIVQRFREFVDQRLAIEDGAPPRAGLHMRQDARLQDFRVKEFRRELEASEALLVQLDSHHVEHDERQRNLYDVLQKRVRDLLTRLTTAVGTLESELRELSDSMNRDSQRGAAALAEPATQFRHEQLRVEIAVLQRRCREDFESTASLLGKMRELTFGGPGAISERPASASPDAPRPSLPLGETERRKRLLDREERRKRGILPAGNDEQTLAATTTTAAAAASAGSEAAEASGAELMSVAVATHDFDPPPTDGTAMLTLRHGDRLVTPGQDVGGWWYGQKMADGSEGYFPPAYVQLTGERSRFK